MSSLTEAWGEDGLFLKKIIKPVLLIFCWLKLFLKLFYVYSVNSIFLSFIRTEVVESAFRKVIDAHSSTNTNNFMLNCGSLSSFNNYLNETEIPHIRLRILLFLHSILNPTACGYITAQASCVWDWCAWLICQRLLTRACICLQITCCRPQWWVLLPVAIETSLPFPPVPLRS